MGDQTFFPTEEVLAELEWPTSVTDKQSRPDALDFLTSFDEGKLKKMQRALVCRCFGGRRWSITARDIERDATPLMSPPKPLPRPDARVRKPDRELWPSDDPNSPYRSDNAKLVGALWELVTRQVEKQGLIVVAGATGSRKTTYAREIARQYLGELLASATDTPHIVTYEDPIESWFAYSPEEAGDAGFNYTPREKGVDVPSLDAAVTNALRQKPALLYVNEVRNDDDWRSLLYFAGTGHFAITTTHAGSLVEAFERILSADGARTPQGRRSTASRIAAIVHLRMHVVGKERFVIPSMWIRTAPALSAMIRDGLSSLLAGASGPCYGHNYFAGRLGYPASIIRAGLRLDLEGK